MKYNNDSGTWLLGQLEPLTFTDQKYFVIPGVSFSTSKIKADAKLLDHASFLYLIVWIVSVSYPGLNVQVMIISFYFANYPAFYHNIMSMDSSFIVSSEFFFFF